MCDAAISWCLLACFWASDQYCLYAIITGETFPSPTQLVECSYLNLDERHYPERYVIWFYCVLQSMLPSNQYGGMLICSGQLVCFSFGPTPEMNLRHVNFIVFIIWRIPWRQCTSYCGLVLSHWGLGMLGPSAVRPWGHNGTIDQREPLTHRPGARFINPFHLR